MCWDNLFGGKETSPMLWFWRMAWQTVKCLYSTHVYKYNTFTDSAPLLRGLPPLKSPLQNWGYLCTCLFPVTFAVSLHLAPCPSSQFTITIPPAKDIWTTPQSLLILLLNGWQCRCWVFQGITKSSLNVQFVSLVAWESGLWYLGHLLSCHCREVPFLQLFESLQLLSI